jgi:hypothetical protein
MKRLFGELEKDTAQWAEQARENLVPKLRRIGFIGGSLMPARWFGADLYETSLIAARNETQLRTTGRAFDSTTCSSSDM